MIVLDTNIISEVMKVSPNSKVVSWLDKQQVSELYITSVTIAEIDYGIRVLPDGNRRRTLEDAFYKAVNTAFKHRVLSFNEDAARLYGKIMSQKKFMGRPMSMPDGQIAAIALANNFFVATRNVKDFAECELTLINPFEW